MKDKAYNTSLLLYALCVYLQLNRLFSKAQNTAMVIESPAEVVLLSLFGRDISINQMSQLNYPIQNIRMRE